MNVLQIYEGYGYDDPVETVIVNISKHMIVKRNNVTILRRNGLRMNPIIASMSGLRFVRLGAPRFSKEKMRVFPHLILDGISFAFEINRYLKKHDDFDVIHSHLPWASNVLILMNRKIRGKMLYTFHADIHRLGFSRRIRTPLYLKLFSPDLFIMKRVRKATVLSESLRRKLVSCGKVRPERVEVVPNGVDTKLFDPNIDTSKIKDKHMLNGRFVVLFVGRISEKKGVEYLVRAARIVVKDLNHRNVLFLLAGWAGGGIFACQKYDPYCTYISMLIRKSNLEENVKLTGYVPYDEVRKLYVASDIFVLPSLEEGFGLVVTEAMASGKPVIGTKVGGIPTQIRDGYNGFLVEPASEEELAEKIRYLIDYPEDRKRMGINSRKLVERELSWAKVAEKYLHVYKDLLTHG